MQLVSRNKQFVRQRMTDVATVANLVTPSLTKIAMKSLLLPLVVAAAPAFAQTAASCPGASEQLTEYLASAKQRIGHDGQVRVTFDVDAQGRAQFVGAQGTRAYRAPVRIATNSLDCLAGTPQRYVMDIRFATPVPRAMASATSVTLAEARR